MPHEITLKDIRIGKRLRRSAIFLANSPTVYEITCIEYPKSRQTNDQWDFVVEISKVEKDGSYKDSVKVDLRKERSMWLAIP